MSADELVRVLALSTQYGVPTLVAALAARLKHDGNEAAAGKVIALAGELAKEHGPGHVPPDRSCARCGAYTKTTCCSGRCAREGGR